MGRPAAVSRAVLFVGFAAVLLKVCQCRYSANHPQLAILRIPRGSMLTSYRHPGVTNKVLPRGTMFIRYQRATTNRIPPSRPVAVPSTQSTRYDTNSDDWLLSEIFRNFKIGGWDYNKESFSPVKQTQNVSDGSSKAASNGHNGMFGWLNHFEPGMSNDQQIQIENPLKDEEQDKQEDSVQYKSYYDPYGWLNTFEAGDNVENRREENNKLSKAPLTPQALDAQLGFLGHGIPVRESNRESESDEEAYPSEQVAYEQTHPVTITREIPVPVITPFPIPVLKYVHVPFIQPLPVHVAQPYPVHVPVKVPYPVVKNVPVKVEKPVPYPVKVPVATPVVKPVPYPVEKPVVVKVGVPIKVPTAKFVDEPPEESISQHADFESYKIAGR